MADGIPYADLVGAADPIERLSYVEIRRREPSAPKGFLTTRSHFDAQDFLEVGASQRMDSGWLNRALAGSERRTFNF